MKKQLVILIIVLTAWTMTDCVTAQDIECDFVSDGLCVKVNGYPVSPERISWLAGMVEQRFNQFYQANPVSLSELVEDNGLVVRYVSPDSTTAYGGYTDALNLIDIRYLAGSNECRDAYYTLAHELLHFLAYKHLGGLAGHFAPVFWGEELSVEEWLYWDVLKAC